MKEKIAKALKTEYASFGLSQKALDGVASIIEKTIKDESEIEAAIKEASVKELLKTFQSELDTFRQDKSRLQKEYEDYKKSHPEGNPNKKEGDDEMAKTLESIMKTQAELKEKLDKADKESKTKAVLADVDRILKEKGSDNDFIRELTIKSITEIKDTDTAETLAEKYKTVYDENFKKAYGDGPVPLKGGENKDYQPGAYKSEVERLRKEGKIPEQKNV